MTKEHFHQLRRGDIVSTAKVSNAASLDMFRVCHKAKFDPEKKMLSIRITCVFMPNLSEWISEDTLDKYHLIPFTKNKYGFKD